MATRPPPEGAPDTGESYRDIAYEHFGVDPSAPARTRRRRLVLGLAATALTGVIAMVSAALFDYWSTGPTTEKALATEEKADAASAPFTVSVRREVSEPENWAMVLDRELSAQEQRRMTSSTDASTVFSYLKSLGGHPVSYVPPLENDPYGRPSAREEFADVFKLHILSTRSSGVVIDGWRVIDVQCRPTAAKGVVGYPPQGGVPYEGVRLHIPPKPYEPILTDDGESQGQPYFDVRRIEVGGGQSSAGLRVEAIAPRGQTCEWGIELHYIDAHQRTDDVELVDSGGDPLRFRTVSAPLAPAQSWVFGAVPWTACHENRSGESMCGLL